MVLLAVMLVIAAFALAIYAGPRLPAAQRFPMQWGLNGQPTWFAPRRFALYFTPVLSAFVTLFTFLLAGSDQHFTAIMAVSFLGAHLLHLWLIRRHLTAP
ncbi:MAG: DUF1648 domain-containing protein [Sulfitobacter sp.]|nr:DUF1648 domain-containing protein [Sulfitobacter sp.]